MRAIWLSLALLAAGCDLAPPSLSPFPAGQSLREARQGFTTQIIRTDAPYGPPDQPDGVEFQLISYQSPVGALPAYVTPDPLDGQRRPAIVWITGGDCNSIGDVWSPADRSNDQTASAFRRAGIVMLFPSQRGGNANPGQREGFYGEVDDILAATEHLAGLPYVDPAQIYLGGHSTGGTLAMLVAASSDRYRAVFALGPVAAANQYGGEFLYCDPSNEQEVALRSPIAWLHCVKAPLYVFEGAVDGNWEAIQMMVGVNTNPSVQFFQVPGHDHFSVIAPLTELLAAQVAQGRLNISQAAVQNLR